MSVIVNAPVHQNSGGFESRVVATVGAGKEAMAHAAFNSGSKANLDEQRKVQEAGTH